MGSASCLPSTTPNRAEYRTAPADGWPFSKFLYALTDLARPAGSFWRDEYAQIAVAGAHSHDERKHRLVIVKSVNWASKLTEFELSANDRAEVS